MKLTWEEKEEIIQMWDEAAATRKTSDKTVHVPIEAYMGMIRWLKEIIADSENESLQ